MTTYTITDLDGQWRKQWRDDSPSPRADAWAEKTLELFAQANRGDFLLLRDGLLMAVSEGLTIRSYRAAPEMMRGAA